MAALGVATTASALDAFDVWHARNASPTVHHLNAVAYGAGRFIAVGNQGTMLTSSNGVEWTVSSPFGTNDLNTIVYVEERFIVGGHKGLIRWSQDGISWTNASVPVTNDVMAIGFGRGKFVPNGLFVASVAIPSVSMPAYSDSRILNSSDGESWTLAANTLIPEATTISFGNDCFAAGAASAASSVAFSSNGNSWQTAPVSGPVAFGGGLFVCLQRFDVNSNGITVLSKTSTNAQFWFPVNVGNGTGHPPAGICFLGDQFIAMGGPGLIATSADGTNWITHFTQIDATLRSVAYGNGTYVAVGDRGVILTSPNSSDWIRRSTTGITLQAVAAADDGFVAVGTAGTAATSDDGVSWHQFKLTDTNNLRDVIQASGKYVVVGVNGVILSGETATNLTPRVSGTPEQLDGIAFGNQTFVAVGGRETIVSSPDGIAWTIRNIGASNRLQTITHGANRFVTAGESGVVLTSDDGIGWTYRNSGTSRPISGITYGNGRFVAACNFAFVIVSTDGIEWKHNLTVRPSATTGIHFANGYFLASAQGGPSPGAALLTSRDGENWTIHANLIGWWTMDAFITGGPMIRHLAFNNGTFVGVGVSGLILQSEPIFQLTIARNEESKVTVQGPTNRTYRIESADSLDTANPWSERTTLSQPPFTWVDDSPTASNRLYRALLVP